MAKQHLRLWTCSTLLQYLLDNYLYCHHGSLLPSLRSVERSQRSSKDGEEEKETDTEILQRDVVEVHVTVWNSISTSTAPPPNPYPTLPCVCTKLQVVHRGCHDSVYNSTLLVNCHWYMCWYMYVPYYTCICFSTQGLLNMQLLHRLRYILEVCRPPSLTVTEILELMTRVARHSLTAANQVQKLSR